MGRGDPAGGSAAAIPPEENDGTTRRFSTIDEFTAEFMKQFGPDVTRNLSTTLGLKPKAAGQVVPAVIPMILGGLKRQMQTQGGPDRLNHILNKYGSADVLDRIDEEMSSRAQQADPDPRLGGLLGSLLGGLFGKRR